MQIEYNIEEKVVKQENRFLIIWGIIMGIMSVTRIILGSLFIVADHDILLGSMNLIIGFIFSFVSIMYFRMYKRDNNQTKLEFISVLPISS